MDDVTVSAARICAIGEVIPAEKPWLDPARPGANRVERCTAGNALWGASVCPCKGCVAAAKFMEVSETVAADGPDWDDIRFVTLGGPTIVIDWHSGGKSLYALDTDETAEQVVEHLRRQRHADN